MEEKDKHLFCLPFSTQLSLYINIQYSSINFDRSLCHIGSIMFNLHIVTDVDFQRNHTLQQLLEWLIPVDGHPLY